ncbi:HBL/NHE enterotoxin family protein [Streptomyces sp. Y1]|uniref:HBL/NHE enterotoxin family protein n=1 Tax=Streptomyces sp. Y1 TaxID=3238634 RepID=A0AB39TTK5_9ACTN
MTATHGAAAAIQSYATLVQLQPDMYFDKIKDRPEVVAELNKVGKDRGTKAVEALTNINAHLAKARTHAQNWTTTLVPTMFDGLEDIRGYAGVHSSVRTTLLARIEEAERQADTIDLDTLKKHLLEAKDGLDSLKLAAQERREKARAMAASLATFQNDLTGDVQAFTADATAVDLLAADNGLVKALNDTIKACNAAIAKDTAMIAGGAVAILVGVGLAALGGVLLFVPGGQVLGGGLIIGGVVAAGTGIGLTTYGAIDLKKQKETLDETAQELTLFQTSLTYFTTAHGTVTHFKDSATKAADGARDLHTRWAAEASSLDQLTKIVGDSAQSARNARTAFGVLSDVKAALVAGTTEWDDALKTANTIHEMLTGVKENVNTKELKLAA